MSKRKAAESENAAVRSPLDQGAAPQQVLVPVPRAWLRAIAALVIVPWLIVAAIYTWRSISHGTAPAAIATAELNSGGSGEPHPWGQLQVTPIVISPPIEYVSSDWGPAEPPRWRFPNLTQSQLEQTLSGAGFDRQQVARLLSVSRADPRTKEFVVSPDLELVRSLAPEVRARLYLQLSKYRVNRRQSGAYRHYANSAKSWLEPSLISPRTLRFIEPFVYRIGDFVYFADIDLVRPEIDDPAELQRLAKGLLREATLLVRLVISDSSRIGEIAEYWGRGGRRTDIRPLLESISMCSPAPSVDISHLLPSLARQQLYRYPKLSSEDYERSGLPDCLWTALNFFNLEPDNRFLDPRIAVEHLKRDYYLIQGNLQLGDIMAFTDSEGDYFHVAVYLADNLVFSKNGNSQFSPWVIIPVDRLKGDYPNHVDDWNVLCFRRKDQ